MPGIAGWQVQICPKFICLLCAACAAVSPMRFSPQHVAILATTFATWISVISVISVTSVSGSCLPESIPEQDRLWVDVSGRKPLRLLVYNWPSAEAFTSIANILINEVLGVHSVMNETIDTVLEAALKLSGCEDIACVEITEDIAHSALETWDSASNELKDFRVAHAEKAPLDLGSVGYTSEDGLYLFPKKFFPGHMMKLGTPWTFTEATTNPITAVCTSSSIAWQICNLLNLWIAMNRNGSIQPLSILMYSTQEIWME